MSDRAEASRAVQQMMQEEKPLEQAMPKDANLEKIVQMDTWREILYDMVAQREINPWDIDVIEVTNKYIGRIKEMKMEDLRVPANLILAAAILLRFKSDMVSLDEAPQQALLDDFAEPFSYSEIAPLELKGRIPPKRRVTLEELVDAVQKVFEDQKVHEEKARMRDELPAQIEPLEIKMSEFKIDEQIDGLFKRINSLVDSEGLVRFSELVEKKDRQGIVYTLLPLLFLANDGKVNMAQDPFFGEIFISVAIQEKKRG